MGKNKQNNCRSIQSTEDFTLKQMFDLSSNLVSEQDEISGFIQLVGRILHGNICNWLVTKELSIFNARRSSSFRILCCVMGRFYKILHLAMHGTMIGMDQMLFELQKLWQNRWRADGCRVEHFPRIQLLQFRKVKNLLYRLGETPENFTGRFFVMSMFNDISCGTRHNERECLANAKFVFFCATRFGKGQWSFIGVGSEKKWYSIKEDSPQGIWDNVVEKMLVEFAESGCPIFRATIPLSRGQIKSKGHGKLSIHYAADQETIETIFRINVFANQLSLYGAVAEMCEDYETLHERTGRHVVMGQWNSSFALSVIKTEVLLDCGDHAYQKYSIPTMWRANWEVVTTRKMK